MKRLIWLSLFMLSAAAPLQAQVYNGHASYTTPTNGTPVPFIWPVGVNWVVVEITGSGASGSGSYYTQLGGAGGAGAYMKVKVPRPVSGISMIEVDVGGVAVPANTNWNGFPGGMTRFDTATCHGSGGGMAPDNSFSPGEGGTPGVCSSGGFDYYWIPGQMGDASTPVDAQGINRDRPKGGCSPRGGCGQGNGQGGIHGGGGAPGNVAIPSGPGGRGQVDVWW